MTSEIIIIKPEDSVSVASNSTGDFPSYVMNRCLISRKSDHFVAKNSSTTFTEKVNNLH